MKHDLTGLSAQGLTRLQSRCQPRCIPFWNLRSFLMFSWFLSRIQFLEVGPDFLADSQPGPTLRLPAIPCHVVAYIFKARRGPSLFSLLHGVLYNNNITMG